jgi:hypothetical protein
MKSIPMNEMFLAEIDESYTSIVAVFGMTQAWNPF